MRILRQQGIYIIPEDVGQPHHEQGGGDLQEPGGQERAIKHGKCVENTSGTKVWVLDH